MKVTVHNAEITSALDKDVIMAYIRSWYSTMTFSSVLVFIQNHKLGKKAVQLSNIDTVLSTAFFKASRSLTDDIDTRPYRVVDANSSGDTITIEFTYYDGQ